MKFNDWIDLAKEKGIKARVAVVAAHDEHTLESIVEAKKEGLVEPVLIGKRNLIEKILESLGENYLDYLILNEDDNTKCVQAAVKQTHEGKVDFIMKGKLETAELMRVVVSRDAGLRTDSTMSLVGFYESPYYHKVFAVTDMGLLTYPSVSQKADAIRNAVNVFNKLGIEEPKVAVLTAVEKVNPKMPECLDAKELKDMNERGEITSCIVEGPISYDLAMSKEAAEIKGYESTVAGDADLLVVPNIQAGNILVKALTVTGGAETCGIIVGAKVPLVLTSRSATARDKFMSIVLASIAGC